jgi:hypothetical protein
MSLFRAPQVPQQPPQYFTPGLALGIPLARVDAQMAQFEAYYRQRAEIQQPQVFKTAPALLSYISAPSLQVPATARWALEWIVENYAVEFTPGLPPGIPQPGQMDQIQATWRCRPEIQQPQIFAAISAPIAVVPAPDFFGFETTPEQPPQQLPSYTVQSPTASQVPASPLQTLPSARWPLEWIVENYAVEFTPGLSLGIPQPKQMDQSAAYIRPRVETQQPAYYFTFTPTNAPTPVQMDQVQASWRQRIEIQQQVYYAPVGQSLGIPLPRQSEQTAAYWRGRIEIPQMAVFSQLATAAGFVPSATLPIPAQASNRQDAQQFAIEPEMAPLMPNAPSFVFAAALQSPAAAMVRWDAQFSVLGVATLTQSAFVPSARDQRILRDRSIDPIQLQPQIAAFFPGTGIPPLNYVTPQREMIARESGRLIISVNGMRLEVPSSGKRLLS